MLRRIGMWAFVLLGVGVAVWGTLGLVAPATSCRGQEMAPGDVCRTANLASDDTGKAQRYEDRIAVARQQAPFAIAAGLATAAFGVVLVLRPQPAPTTG